MSPVPDERNETGSTKIHHVSTADAHAAREVVRLETTRPNLEDYKRTILKRYREGGFDKSVVSYQNAGSKSSIAKKVKKVKEEIENEGLEQDIHLKRWTLYILFGFLSVETVAIFAYSYFQATYLFGFQLEEWSFKLLVAATITQITYMCQMAVKHLFPGKK